MPNSTTIYDVYTDAQLGAVGWISGPTAILSFLSSFLIIQHVVRNSIQKGKSRTYDRMVFGLSLTDMISSAAIFASRIFFGVNRQPLPGEPSCTALAFAIVTAVGCSSLYNACLSIYFMLIVCFNVTDRVIAIYLEPTFHFLCIPLVLLTSVLAIFAEMYNPTGYQIGCWMNAYPADCKHDCDRGADWGWHLKQTSLGVFYAVSVTLVTTNVMLYCKVRATEERSRESRVSQQPQRRTSTQKVAMQSFLFCFGFVLTYILGAVNSLVPQRYMYTWWYFALGLVSNFFLPLQGFFDCLVYFRPRYLKWRQRRPNERRWETIKLVLFTTCRIPNAATCTNRRNSEEDSDEHLSTPSWLRSAEQIPSPFDDIPSEFRVDESSLELKLAELTSNQRRRSSGFSQTEVNAAAPLEECVEDESTESATGPCNGVVG